MPRRFLSYANVAATLALVLSMTGASLAAAHWLITSSSQIKPGTITLKNLSGHTRNSLHGKTGARGPQGSPGLQGLQGLQGPAGNPAVPNVTESGQAVVSIPSTSTGATDVADFTEPAGKSLILYSVNDRNASNVSVVLDCHIQATNQTGNGVAYSEALVPALSNGNTETANQGSQQVNAVSTATAMPLLCQQIGTNPSTTLSAQPYVTVIPVTGG